MAAVDTSTSDETRARSRRGTTRAEGPPRDLTERMNLYAKSIAIGVLIALIGVGAFGRFYSARFNGLVSTQAMEVADIAQQLRFNRGFSTRVVRPLALSYATPDADGTVPETRHQPLYPLLVSLLFRVRGGGDASMAMFNGLMLLLTGWVIYAIGRMAWDKPVGLLATAIYFVSIDAIGQALTATSASLAGLLVTVAIWAALRNRMSAKEEDETQDAGARGSLMWCAVLGGAFGLAWLSGSTAAMLIIPLAILGSVPG
ncbi:MAG: ArnT family glycosyltransferase, partial [Armatimonadota bacterium]